MAALPSVDALLKVAELRTTDTPVNVSALGSLMWLPSPVRVDTGLSTPPRTLRPATPPLQLILDVEMCSGSPSLSEYSPTSPAQPSGNQPTGTLAGWSMPSMVKEPSAPSPFQKITLSRRMFLAPTANPLCPPLLLVRCVTPRPVQPIPPLMPLSLQRGAPNSKPTPPFLSLLVAHCPTPLPCPVPSLL